VLQDAGIKVSSVASETLGACAFFCVSVGS